MYGSTETMQQRLLTGDSVQSILRHPYIPTSGLRPADILLTPRSTINNLRGHGCPTTLIALLQRPFRPRVMLVGDVMLDRYVWGDVERISPEAPIPVLRVGKREHRLGGAGSVASMLVALEAETAAGLRHRRRRGRPHRPRIAGNDRRRLPLPG